MLKLKARQQRHIEQAAIAQAEIANDPGSFFAKLAGGQIEHASLLQQQFEVILKEAVKSEKKEWIKKLHEENKLMLQVLEDVKESKIELANKIRELESAREWIKALKQHTHSDAIDDYMRNLCPLRPEARRAMQLSEDKEAECARIFERMESAVMKHKSQQSELSEYISNALQNISEHFTEGKEEETMRLLDRLDSVVSSGPHNVHAANMLSLALEKTLVAASAEKISALLKQEVSKRFQVVHAEVSTQRLRGSFSETKSSAEAQPTIPDSVTEELRTLTAQNETLRQTVTQLRQKLAQQKVNGGNAHNNNSSSNHTQKNKQSHNNNISSNNSHSNASSGGVVRSSSGDRSPENNNIFTGSGNTATLNNLFSETNNSLQPQNLFSTQHSAAEVRNTSLPAPLQSALSEKVKSYVHQIVEGHPIASRLSPEAIQLAEEEILLNSIDFAAVTFTALLLNEKNAALMKQLLDPAVCTDEMVRGKENSEMLNNIANNVMKLTTVHTEIASLVTLYLTYMFYRSANEPAPPADSSTEEPPMGHAERAVDEHSEMDTFSPTRAPTPPVPTAIPPQLPRQNTAYRPTPTPLANVVASNRNSNNNLQDGAPSREEDRASPSLATSSVTNSLGPYSTDASVGVGEISIMPRPQMMKTDSVPRYMQPKRSRQNVMTGSGASTPR